MCGGHWVPEMVDLAGGSNTFGDQDTGTFKLEWDEVVERQPDVIVMMPCGFDVKRGLEDVPILAEREGWKDLPAVRNDRVYVVDASAYTSRSGPRLVTGLEIMAEMIHRSSSAATSRSRAPCGCSGRRLEESGKA